MKKVVKTVRSNKPFVAKVKQKIVTNIIPSLERQEGGNHYKDKPIQPIEYNYHNDLPFIEGTVVKYVTRWRDKGGLQDIRKAIHFLEMLIELEEGSEVKVRNKERV